MPNNTARVSEATTGLSSGRITSSLNTLARAMFSPRVWPLAVTAERSSRSPRLFSSAGSPPLRSEAKAGLANIRKVIEDGKPAIALDISRSGDRSTFGEVRVLKAGVAEPIAIIRGVAVYTELDKRSVTIPIDPAHVAQAIGQVTVQYIEPTDTGPVTIAETTAVLR